MKLKELLNIIELETLYEDFHIKSINRMWTLISYCHVQKEYEYIETKELSFLDDIKEIRDMTVFEYVSNYLGNENVLSIEHDEFSQVINIIIA